MPAVARAGALIALLAGLALGLGGPAKATTPTYTTNYVWDAERRLTMVIEADPGTGIRPATQFLYDLDGNLVEVDKGTTQADGSNFAAAETTLYSYDAAGREAQATILNGVNANTAQNPALSVTQTAYDADDRPTCVAVRMNPSVFPSTLPGACTLGTQGSFGNDRITLTTYDNAGQVQRVTRAYGDASLQEVYEYYCNPITYPLATSPAPPSVNCYSPNGKELTVTDAVGNTTTYAYDGFDRLSTTTFPVTARAAGQSDATDYESYQYDANSNRVALRKRDGRYVSWCYDSLSRETEKYVQETTAPVACAAPPAPSGNDVATNYDLLSRKHSATFAAGLAITYGWDNASRLISEATGSRTLSFGYDAASNRNQVTWPDAFYASYAVDALNRVQAICQNIAPLNCVSGSANLLVAVNYDNLDRRSALNRYNGASTTFSYDYADRLTSLAHSFPGTPSDNQSYTYAYNPAGQTLNATQPTGPFAWSNHPSVNSSKTYDGLNRDASIASVGAPCGSGGGVSHGYDCNGNLTNDGAHANGYDVENRLTSVSNAGTGSSLLTLVYDPLGRLQQTTSPSATTQFLYDGDRLAAEYSGSGTLLRRYVMGPGVDEPMVWIEYTSGTVINWLHADRQGSIIAASNSSGAVPTGSTYAYGPYGEPQSWGGSRFAYTGQIQLPEAQLYHYKARAYDPSRGWFLQTDPIGYQSDLDLYSYAREDPIGKVDPAGTMPDDCAACISHPTLLDEKTARQITRILAKVASVVGEAVYSAAAAPPFAGAAGREEEAEAFAESRAEARAIRAAQLARNQVNGARAEASTAARLGDSVAARRVTLESSTTGRRSVVDFVTSDRGVVESKHGNAQLSQGQEDVRDDIAGGRPVIPRGDNAAKGGLTPGQPTRMRSCHIDRTCRYR
jgi:RHS repeat-associated protein